MGHIAVLSRKSVGQRNKSFIILIELILNKYQTTLSIDIRESFQRDWHTVSIGAGMSHHNYFSYSRILNPYGETFEYKDYRDVENFKRFKVNANYADIPLELRFRIKDQVKISVGFKLGILVMGKTKYVGPDEDGIIIHEKYTYMDNLERYAYSATLRVGWKWVSAFAAYQINPVFEVGHEAPTFHPLSVGVTFAPF